MALLRVNFYFSKIGMYLPACLATRLCQRVLNFGDLVCDQQITKLNYRQLSRIIQQKNFDHVSLTITGIACDVLSGLVHSIGVHDLTARRQVES